MMEGARQRRFLRGLRLKAGSFITQLKESQIGQIARKRPGAVFVTEIFCAVYWKSARCADPTFIGTDIDTDSEVREKPRLKISMKDPRT